MTSGYCYCNCNEIYNNYYDENPNFTIPCRNNLDEKDPEIIHCPWCCDFQIETDNSKSSKSALESDERKSNDNFCQDILLVDGNQADFNECEDESILIERVWFLSEPPLTQKQVFTVPARRVQVVRERLSSTVKCVPTIKENLRPQIEKKMNTRRLKKKNSDYVQVKRIFFADEKEDSEIILPPCAQKLSEFM